ncbi:Fungal Zn2-Cys6 binuclear cluster domain-containing protein [Cladophialophora immunda]|nr:Fungal Zn2-Cys6 binuclear cluster domain-containing protein [Cladophialophora immunda]
MLESDDFCNTKEDMLYPIIETVYRQYVNVPYLPPLSKIHQVLRALEMIQDLTETFTHLPYKRPMNQSRPGMETSTPASGLNPPRRKASTACFSCKIRKSKCSGGNPCSACSRSRLECMYNASLDRRRKIHWERAETEAALQKQMLQRLLELIRAGGDEMRQRLRDDPLIRTLSQRLGMDMPEHAAASSSSDPHESWASAHARKTNRREFGEDVSQKEELTRRRGSFPEGVQDVAPEAAPSNALISPAGSLDELWDLPIPSEATVQRTKNPDPRVQFRIFCSTDHDAPNVESIRIFGDSSFLSANPSTIQDFAWQRQQLLNLDLPEYLIQPMLFEGERCPMAAAYTDFRDYGRGQLAAGLPIEFVLGSPQIDLALYFRGRTPEDAHTPATWACEYMRLLANCDIYVALAWIFTYAHFMRVSVMTPNTGEDRTLC